MKTHYMVLWVALGLFATKAMAQDRPAYWVHGLNDNDLTQDNVWVHYDALFAAEHQLGLQRMPLIIPDRV